MYRDYAEHMSFMLRTLLRSQPTRSLRCQPSVRHTMQHSGPLRVEDGPLVWIDCEMTGLEPKRDRILEIAVIVTDGELQPVDDGVCYVISTPKSVLDRQDLVFHKYWTLLTRS